MAPDIAGACGIKPPSDPTPNFEYDSDQLTAQDRAVLDQLATCLTSGALKGKPVSLIGRADPRGTEEYNLGLGSRRAHSVSQYLVRLGVPSPQLTSSNDILSALAGQARYVCAGVFARPQLVTPTIKKNPQSTEVECWPGGAKLLRHISQSVFELGRLLS